MKVALLFLVFFVAASNGTLQPPLPEGVVDLRENYTFELRAGVFTNTKSVSPLPQISCHGNGCRYFSPKKITCWTVPPSSKCKGALWAFSCDLHDGESEPGVEVELKKMRFETYRDHSDDPAASREDPWIVEGSCSLEIDLKVCFSKLEKRKKPPSKPQDDDDDDDVPRLSSLQLDKLLACLGSWFFVLWCLRRIVAYGGLEEKISDLEEKVVALLKDERREVKKEIDGEGNEESDGDVNPCGEEEEKEDGTT